MLRSPFLALWRPPCDSPAWIPQLTLVSSFAGPYSLTYQSSGISEPKEGFSSFQATGYLNDQAFFHYDSKSEKAEPLGPWKQVKGMEDWEELSKLQKARGDFFLKNLRDIMGYYKDTGQWTMGCWGGQS